MHPQPLVQAAQLGRPAGVIEDEEGVVSTGRDDGADLDAVAVGDLEEALAAVVADRVPLRPRTQHHADAARVDQPGRAGLQDLVRSVAEGGYNAALAPQIAAHRCAGPERGAQGEAMTNRKN